MLRGIHVKIQSARQCSSLCPSPQAKHGCRLPLLPGQTDTMRAELPQQGQEWGSGGGKEKQHTEVTERQEGKDKMRGEEKEMRKGQS